MFRRVEGRGAVCTKEDARVDRRISLRLLSGTPLLESFIPHVALCVIEISRVRDGALFPWITMLDLLA